MLHNPQQHDQSTPSMVDISREAYPDLPVLDGYTEGGQVMVWCEHERDWHYHGRCTGRCAPRVRLAEAGRPVIAGTPCECPPGSGDGHRHPHCRCSRSRTSGYIIREVGAWTRAVRASHRVSRASECPGAECVEARRQAVEDRWRRPFGEDVLEATCPTCHRPPGEMCVIRRGRVHSARVTARMRARLDARFGNRGRS